MTCNEDIEHIIGNMRTNKTCDPNSAPIKILRKCKNELAKQLSDIINISFTMGKFLNSTKKTKIIPVYRKDDKLNCSNFRPLSPIPSLIKMFEKIIHQRLPTFIEIDNKFSDSNLDFKTNTLHPIQ